MWTQHQAAAALRKVVALAGAQAEEYALHSLRIGGAMHVQAVGLHHRCCSVRPGGRKKKAVRSQSRKGRRLGSEPNGLWWTRKWYRVQESGLANPH